MWDELAPMPELPRYYVGVAGAKHRVFVVGGLSAGPEALAVHTYDVVTKQWKRLKDLPEPMRMPNVAAVGDRLFVLGALDVVDSFEYDFNNDRWLPRASLPAGHGPGASAIGVSGNTVFVAGGVLPGVSANLLNTGMRVAGVYSYDSVNDRWSTLPSLPIAVGYAMGALHNGELWVMGGSDNHARTDRVEAFNTATHTWKEKPKLPLALSSAACGVLDGRIYIAGGIATSVGAISGLTLAFNDASQAWEGAAPIPTPRFAVGGAVIDNKLYVVAGIHAENPMPIVDAGADAGWDAAAADAASAGPGAGGSQQMGPLFVPVGILEVFTP
jgi:N-acetylneuraminic acid mutarotase